MSSENKKIIANNIQRYMDLNNVTRFDVCEALGFKYSTLSEWLQANKYPRPDKIDALAAYFHCTRSDLVDPPAAGTVNITGNTGNITGNTIAGTINAGTFTANIPAPGQGSEISDMYKALPADARRRVDRMIKGEYEDAQQSK